MSRTPAVQLMQFVENPGISTEKPSSKNSSLDGSVNFRRELEGAINRIDERKKAFSADSSREVQGKSKVAVGASEGKDLKEPEFKGTPESSGQGKNTGEAEGNGAVELAAGLGLIMQAAQLLERGGASPLTGNGVSASSGTLPGNGMEGVLKVLPGVLMGAPLEASSEKDASSAAALPTAFASAESGVSEAEAFLMVPEKGALETQGASVGKAEGRLPLNDLGQKDEAEKPGLKGSEKASAEGVVKAHCGMTDKSAEALAKVLKTPLDLSSGRTVNPGDAAENGAFGGRSSPEVSGALQKAVIVNDAGTAADGAKSTIQGSFIERLSMILREQMVQKSRFLHQRESRR
ncbi:MAG: hypothetical protein XD50_0121 [Clostridia bacterium 41_269]|nr:MAG: hypothetical protein XD50_0121 [Clostridia bacterium 41_269]